jgi:hypothetical protein
MTTTTLAPQDQIANVQACLLRCCRRLQHWGLTMRQARRLAGRVTTHRVGRKGWSQDAARLSDALAAVAALDQWRETKALHARGELAPLVLLDDVAF